MYANNTQQFSDYYSFLSAHAYCDAKTIIPASKQTILLRNYMIFMMWIFYPLAGWLACSHIHFGRHKTLCCSTCIWIMQLLYYSLQQVLSPSSMKTQSLLYTSWAMAFLYLIKQISYNSVLTNLLIHALF